MRRDRIGLLVALGIDNVGSGLFLPLALLYATRAVGLTLGQAGLAVTVGTAAGLAVPAVAGRFVDRLGPRPVVITAQLTQAAGALTYLVAHGVVLVVVAAVLLAAGQQLFYSSLFALIADVAGEGPKDRPFAVVAMVRSACFGAGGLIVGALLTTVAPAGYRVAVAVDGASFLACALLLTLLVHPPHPRQATDGPPVSDRRLLTDRPYLALIGITTLVALSADFLLVGVPVYVLDVLHAPVWLPGAVLALLTALTTVGGPTVVRLTRRQSRIATLSLGAAVTVTWSAASLAAVLVPQGWRAAYVLACTVVLAAAASLFGPRLNALAEAAAPRESRGRYLAAFQYSFTVAGVLAPAVVALFSVATWLPWALVAVCAGAAIPALRWISPRLPAHAVTPEPVA
jgi:MFS family permease